MCSLCSALGGSRYWTDAAGRPAFEISGLKTTLMAERRRRVALINNILECYGIAISDWGGSSYVLEHVDGRTANIYNLAEVWTEADRLSGRACDPLDPAVIEHLNARKASAGST